MTDCRVNLTEIQSVTRSVIMGEPELLNHIFQVDSVNYWLATPVFMLLFSQQPADYINTSCLEVLGTCRRPDLSGIIACMMEWPDWNDDREYPH